MKYHIVQIVKIFLKRFIPFLVMPYVMVTAVWGPFLWAGELRLSKAQITQLTLNDMLTGKKLIITDKPMYVVFWASWCVACKVELKHLKKGYQKYKNQILTVSLDKRRKNAQKLLRKLSWSFKSIYDQESQWKKLFKIESLPYSLILIPDGSNEWIVKKSSSRLLAIHVLEKLLF